MLVSPLFAAPAAALALASLALPARAEALAAPSQAAAVVDFWRDVGPKLWFAKDAAFDHRFRERFQGHYAAAVRGELAAWTDTPDGALALLILLDQYPRNAFRGTPRMYASDDQARAVADMAVARGFDTRIAADLRVFVYLPYAHSESLEDQAKSVALVASLGEENLAHARRHQEIVRRFGRFPHRNAILGRASTSEERAYLAAGGYAG